LACKFEKKRRDAHRFLKGVSNGSLLERRLQHERERAADDMPGPVGSVRRGGRLIWMRTVRTLIRERKLEP
jgi:hypothetical protein